MNKPDPIAVNDKVVVPTRAFWYSDVLVFPKLITIVTTLDENGVVNAAPYSFIMQYDVMTKNPRLILGFRSSSDTYRNIEQTGELVINCIRYDHLEDMMETARFYEPGVNELDHTRFTSIPSKKVKPPSLLEAPQIIECTVDRVYALDRSQGQVLARIEALVFDKGLQEMDRGERIEAMNLPVGLGDTKRRYYYYTSTRDTCMHELEPDPDLARAQDLESRVQMEWEPAALEALHTVPKAVLDLVIKSTEEVVEEQGMQRVTYEKFRELADDFAPPEVLDRIDDGTVEEADTEVIAQGPIADMAWRARSREMFHEAVNAAPGPMRDFTQEQLTKAMEKSVSSGEITEQLILNCIREITPEPFLPRVMARLEPLLG